MSKDKTVINILRQWLTSNGYDGLYVVGECGCLVDDLVPCGAVEAEVCTAGYKVDGCDDDCPIGECDWHVQAEKP